MLPTVTLDPSTIWIIDSSDTEEVASGAITSALEWMRPHAAGPLSLFFSSRSVDALAQAGAFPSEPRFAEVLTSLGLANVISPKTLAASVSRFLASNPWIEEQVDLRDVLFHATTIAPDPTLAIPAQGLRTASVETLGLLGICARENGRHSVYAFSRLNDEHARIRVTTTVDILEIAENDARTEEAIDVEIDVISSPGAWSRALSSKQIWRDADCPADLEVAIWLAASELEKISGGGMREFRVGSAFFGTLQACGADGDGAYAESVLMKCAQTVLFRSNLRPAPFWTSTARVSVRERKRDRAKAWRQHVTKSHQALRLMYWEAPNGLVEFATLESKVEESIADGDALEPRGW